MKKKLFIVIIFQVLLFNYLCAQSDFREGYVITANKDTLYGTINNRNYSENSMECEFRRGNENEVTKYTPSDLIGYKFKDGKFYVTKVLEGKLIFLEYLVNGKLDFYFLRDKIGNNYYYVSNDGGITLTELKYHEEIKYADDPEEKKTHEGIATLYEYRDFANVLTYYTAAYPSFAENIKRIRKPNHWDLINLANEYQALTCKDEKCIVYEKNIKKNVKLNLSVRQNKFFPNDGSSDFTSWGFNLLFRESQKNERIFLGLGFIYAGVLSEVIDNGTDAPYTKHTMQYYIPLSVNYLHPKQGLSPVISYTFYLNMLKYQTFDLGVKYQMAGTAVSLSSELYTRDVAVPIGAAIVVGLTFDL